MPDARIGEVSWERMIRAVERIQERLRRAARALDEAHVSYAVIGGLAVAAWVSRVDESAVRNTRDVDLLLRREDLTRAEAALVRAGFAYRHVAGVDLFLDGPDARPRDAVHVVFAGEKVREEYLLPAPQVDEISDEPSFRLLSLEALVRMKLTSFRARDQMHLRDLIEVGLVDRTWREKLPLPLADRLGKLLETPE